MKKRIAAILFGSALALTLCACGGGDAGTTTDTSDNSAGDTTQAADVAKDEETVYKIGDTWTVDGQWTLTIDSVETISDRNEFSDKNPTAVYMVNYTYTNTGYEDAMGMMNGLYLDLSSMRVVDSASNMGYTYPGNIVDNPQETPVGATCKAQACFGVDNAGTFKIIVDQYDGNSKEQSATFQIDVDA